MPAWARSLTDDPYYDTDPVPIDDGQFFVGDLIGGRLVETPAQIAGQLDRYAAANGQLARSTAFSEGYDFTKDGATVGQQTASARRSEQANVRQLINDNWTGTQLLGTGGLFPTAGASTFNLLNGHFDHFRMLTANGNAQGTIETVSATALSGSLLGRVLFTVGCHSAFPVSRRDRRRHDAGEGLAGDHGRQARALGRTDGLRLRRHRHGRLLRAADVVPRHAAGRPAVDRRGVDPRQAGLLPDRRRHAVVVRPQGAARSDDVRPAVLRRRRRTDRHSRRAVRRAGRGRHRTSTTPADGTLGERPGQRPALGGVLAHADLHARAPARRHSTTRTPAR